jgi:ATP-dependent Clp protease ATP-binding subunit ClpA
MTAFDQYVHTIVEQAGHEARKDGSATMEAHHLLLAIAAEQEPTTQQILTSVGLDHQAIRDALDREFEHSLHAAGVSRAAFDLPRPSNATRPRCEA